VNGSQSACDSGCGLLTDVLALAMDVAFTAPFKSLPSLHPPFPHKQILLVLNICTKPVLP